MLIFGLGSGRCGTQSFAEVLNCQEGVICFHEMNPSAMAWDGAQCNMRATVNQFDLLIRQGICTIVTDLNGPDRSEPLRQTSLGDRPWCIGDIAFYYLPHVELILSMTKDVRFPCLRRDRKETIVSFKKKLEINSHSNLMKFLMWVRGRSNLRNHWYQGDGKIWINDPRWDRLFPKSDLKHGDIEHFIGEWYDNYYEEVEQLESKYPEHVRIFQTDDLNTEQRQIDLLHFCGIACDKVKFVKARSNRSSQGRLK